MLKNNSSKGFTLIELLVVMSIIALLLSILVPALSSAREKANLTKDKSQIQAILKGFLSFDTNSQQMPTPSVKCRGEYPVGNGTYFDGVGAELIGYNEHGSMLSMCIMENLFEASTIISPTDPIAIAINGYAYETYRPAHKSERGVYWHPVAVENGPDQPDSYASVNVDDLFCNYLESGSPADQYGSHNSYAFMPITGERRKKNWRIGGRLASEFVMMGTRGVPGGHVYTGTADQLAEEIPMDFYGVPGEFQGLWGFGDGHVEENTGFFTNTSVNCPGGNASGVGVLDDPYYEDQFGADGGLNCDLAGNYESLDMFIGHIVEVQQPTDDNSDYTLQSYTTVSYDDPG